MTTIPTSIFGGNAVKATRKYELIRPILKGEKTAKQASEATDIPVALCKPSSTKPEAPSW